MSELDKIKPKHSSGLYKLEILVEGQWMAGALVSKGTIGAITDELEELSDADVEEVEAQ